MPSRTVGSPLEGLQVEVAVLGEERLERGACLEVLVEGARAQPVGGVGADEQAPVGAGPLGCPGGEPWQVAGEDRPRVQPVWLVEGEQFVDKLEQLLGFAVSVGGRVGVGDGGGEGPHRAPVERPVSRGGVGLLVG